MKAVRKIAIIAVIFFPAASLYAQESRSEALPETSRPLFFVAPVAEAVWYGRALPSMGFGLALGTEGKVSMGLKGIYAMPLALQEVTTIEITLLLRLYPFPGSR